MVIASYRAVLNNTLRMLSGLAACGVTTELDLDDVHSAAMQLNVIGMGA